MAQNEVNSAESVKGASSTALTRDDVLKTMAYLLDFCENKVRLGRAPKDYDAEKNRHMWCRTGIYACSVALSGIRDADNVVSEDLLSELTEIKNRVTA